MTEMQVIVAERGWVFVGDIGRDGDMVVISNCHNVRRWDANKGIGRLALDGPDSTSILNPCGVVRIHVLAVVAFVECNADAPAWRQWRDAHAGAAPPKPKKTKS